MLGLQRFHLDVCLPKSDKSCLIALSPRLQNVCTVAEGRAYFPRGVLNWPTDPFHQELVVVLSEDAFHFVLLVPHLGTSAEPIVSGCKHAFCSPPADTYPRAHGSPSIDRRQSRSPDRRPHRYMKDARERV